MAIVNKNYKNFFQLKLCDNVDKSSHDLVKKTKRRTIHNGKYL